MDEDTIRRRFIAHSWPHGIAERTPQDREEDARIRWHADIDVEDLKRRICVSRASEYVRPKRQNG